MKTVPKKITAIKKFKRRHLKLLEEYRKANIKMPVWIVESKEE